MAANSEGNSFANASQSDGGVKLRRIDKDVLWTSRRAYKVGGLSFCQRLGDRVLGGGMTTDNTVDNVTSAW